MEEKTPTESRRGIKEEDDEDEEEKGGCCEETFNRSEQMAKL